jgi:Domain of unknown function (DUF1835)
MPNQFHITNGDSAAGTIRQAGLAGDVLPWRDALHEGPVPRLPTIEELSVVRAEFIAREWTPSSTMDVSGEFKDRDRLLRVHTRSSEITLWFEADLYDQLQLLQLLDWFQAHPSVYPLHLICIGEHEEIPRFDGLGQLSPTQMAALIPRRQPVLDDHCELAARAWSAFTAADPSELARLVDHTDTSTLPFLRDALRRHLQELPHVRGGLSRTERQSLQLLREGPRTLKDLFIVNQRLEDRVFMGDSIFHYRMEQMSRGPAPAIHLAPGEKTTSPTAPRWLTMAATLTSAGARYLDGADDFVESNGVDRWMGGVHLTSATQWRWDEHQGVRHYPT